MVWPQGIRSGVTPYKLHSGGEGFWDTLKSNPQAAARFDQAMVQDNHFGGSAVVNTVAWGQYSRVIDVAGGVGGFMAELMHRVPGLKQGVVFDLPGNIDRAKKVGAGMRLSRVGECGNVLVLLQSARAAFCQRLAHCNLRPAWDPGVVSATARQAQHKC